MEPQASSGPVPRTRWATHGSFASVLAVGSLFLITAPHPDSGKKQGATRPTAVQPGETAKPAASSDAQIKVIGASTDNGKPCDEQTWPYIDKSCLTIAHGKPAPSKTEPATPLGLRDLLAGVRSTPAVAPATTPPPAREIEDQPVGSITAIAPTPPVKAMQANTVGAAPQDDPSALADEPAATDSVDVPLPPSRPDVALASFADTQDMDDDVAAAPPMSRADYRRWEREQRRAMREMERERRRQEWAERRAANPNRIVRRWTEYSYDDDSRVVVIQQGSSRDRFFQTYR
jgi:hypothetical protein